MNLHMDSSDTMDGPETYTQGMAPSSLSQSMAPTKTSGNIVVFGEYCFYVVNQRRTLSVLDCTDCMRRKRWKLYQDINRMQLVGNCLEVF
jgi:hypothetical protein